MWKGLEVTGTNVLRICEYFSTAGEWGAWGLEEGRRESKRGLRSQTKEARPYREGDRDTIKSYVSGNDLAAVLWTGRQDMRGRNLVSMSRGRAAEY